MALVVQGLCPLPKILWVALPAMGGRGYLGSNRVKRGGNRNDGNAQNFRSANRNNTPSNRNNNNGFRVVGVPPGQ